MDWHPAAAAALFGVCVDSFACVCVQRNQIVVVMIHTFSQYVSYNQYFSLFFIVHEVVWRE